MINNLDDEFKKYFDSIDYDYTGDFKLDQKEAFEAGWNAARQWQTIETAPKGTEILFVDKRGFIGICWWPKVRKGWESLHALRYDECEVPTHWMPLPESPME